MSGAPTTGLVTVEDLHVVYQRGATPAVDGVSFTIGSGEGLLLTGARGSGTTSVLRAVLGLVPLSGAVRLLGRIPGDPAAMRRTGYGPQGKAFAAGFSPRRLVALVAALREVDDAGRAADAALERAGLAVGADRPAVDVEVVRRTALACALVGEPEVIVLDDPWEFPETVAAIAAVRDRGGAVLAASHDPGGLPALLGRTLTLANGAVA